MNSADEPVANCAGDGEASRRLEEFRRQVQEGVDQANRGEVNILDINAIKAKARQRLTTD